jgi:ATP-dependent RNA helicase DHX37/DHR1
MLRAALKLPLVEGDDDDIQGGGDWSAGGNTVMVPVEDKVEDEGYTPQQLKQFVQMMTAALKLPLVKDSSSESNMAKSSAASESRVDITRPVTKKSRPAWYEAPNRPAGVQEARMELPICAMEQEIMEAITDNTILVLCGETGCGKTTQVPQFLWEAGWGRAEAGKPGMIGVTQPRRVAAVATAKRVSHELGCACDKSSMVGYQVRYDNQTTSEKTRLKFMTDGILLKEIQSDFLLRKYSVIILDEAHERNLNTDVLIGLLSRSIPMRNKLYKDQQRRRRQRQQQRSSGGDDSSDDDDDDNPVLSPLKLIIMSATLRVSDFTQNLRVFPNPPPVVRVPARQFPVTVHFNRHTIVDDYVQAAFSKVCQIHKKLPPGGVLVFVTGQQEIHDLCRKLRGAASNRKARAQKKKDAGPVKIRDAIQTLEKAREKEEADRERLRRAANGVGGDDDEHILDNDDMADEADLRDAEKNADPLENDGSDDDDDVDEDLSEESQIWVLPLYSMLPPEQQMKVFEPVPENARLIVISTNIAETSITIPGIRYVVDTGRVKERVWDLRTGVSEFQVEWISRASANQRTGRAGRTGPGHCYRLFSSAYYNDHLEEFAEPETLRLPVSETVLQMKAMGVEDVANFPFPTPPNKESLDSALEELAVIGALDPKTNRLTPLGKILARLPISPRYGKVLVLGVKSDMLQYAITAVAAMSFQSPFLWRRQASAVLDNDATSVATTEDAATGKVETVTGKDTGTDGDEHRMNRAWLTAKDAPGQSYGSTIAETQKAYAETGMANEDKLKKKAFHDRLTAMWSDETSDVLSLLRVAGAYSFCQHSKKQARKFCTDNELHAKTMEQMYLLREQLTRIAARVFNLDPAHPSLNLQIQPPSESQVFFWNILDMLGLSFSTDSPFKSNRNPPYFHLDQTSMPCCLCTHHLPPHFPPFPVFYLSPLPHPCRMHRKRPC